VRFGVQYSSFNYFFMALCASAKQPFAFAAFRRREAAEALKAQDIPAQGKHTKSVRRPG
jgi:hypothetical protein